MELDQSKVPHRDIVVIPIEEEEPEDRLASADYPDYPDRALSPNPSDTGIDSVIIPVQIIYRNLTVTVDVKNKDFKENVGFRLPGKSVKKPKIILKELNGVFQPGRLTAILGPSGSGKTTLLNAVSGFLNTGRVEGDILLNGYKVSGHAIRLASGYVYQDDVILPTMTVREAISMSVLLRLPKFPSDERVKRMVNRVIKILQLEKAADTIIGNSTIRGISGGERKRCAVAMEMVTNPSVLFLDEPTSGLDAFTAVSIIGILKLLAKSGRTVVASIHQPSSEIFHMFDDLLILAEGEVVYFGEAEKAVDYFAKQGFVCPQYNNPADFIFMNVLNEFNMDSLHLFVEKDGQYSEKPVADRAKKFATYYKASENFRKVLAITESPLKEKIDLRMIKFKSSFVTQYSYLTKRALMNAWRNKMMIKTRVSQTVFFSLVIGVIFYRLDEQPTNAVIQGTNGVLFFAAVNQFFTSAMSTISVYSVERQVVQREFARGYYSVLAYYCSKILTELPYQMVLPILFSSISYWMVGFQATTSKFFIYMALCVLVSLNGIGVGLLTASIFKDFIIALTILPAFLLPAMLFGGLFVNNTNAPKWLSWIQWLSPVQYAFNAFTKNEYAGLTHNGQDIGRQTLKDLNFDGGFSILVNCIFLLGLYVIFMVGAHFALRFLVLKDGIDDQQGKRDLKAALRSSFKTGN